MKPLLIAIFSLLGFSASAQTDSPVKGNSQIILVCNDTGPDLYKRFGTYLVSKGYSMDQSSSEFLTIKMAPKATTKFNLEYILSIAIIDKNVRITSTWSIRDFNDGNNEWKFHNDKMSNAPGIVYNDVMALLKDFEKEKIQFQ